MKLAVQTLITLLIFFFIGSFSVVDARSGCCSHHGGVCGSSCCDGSPLSAKCGGGGSINQYVPQKNYEPQEYIPPSFTMPPVSGSVNYAYNQKTKSYSVSVDWDDVIGSSGYSIAISRSAGINPGPLVDTFSSDWTFTKVSPGTWYINLKAKKGSQWSDNVTYWTVTVPAIPTTAAVKAANVKQTVKKIPIWKPTRVPTLKPTSIPAPKYVCNCSKTCAQMSSCDEAQYQLNVCGCSRRDADHDGVACDADCQ